MNISNKINNLFEDKNVHESNLDSVINKMGRLVQGNAHTKAYILGANFLKLKKLETIFKAIEDIQNTEHHLPPEISKYRYRMYEQLKAYAKQKLSDEDYTKFYNVL